MTPENPAKLLNVVNAIKDNAHIQTDMDNLLKNIRRCLVNGLNLKLSWSVIRNDDHTLDCHADYLADRMEGKPTDLPRDTGTPACAISVLSGKSASFKSPSKICEDCRLVHDCEQCTTYCAPILYSGETLGVLGVTALETSYCDQQVFESLVAQVAMAMRLVTLENAQKNTDELLLKASKKMELALNGGATGLWDWNIDNGKLSFDDHWNHLFQMGDGQAASGWRENPWGQIVIEGDTPAVYEAKFSRETEELSFYESEHRVRIRKNQWRWVHIKGSITERGENGQPQRASGTIFDITVRKANELEKDKLSEQLRQIQKIESIGRLAGGIAHDLNNLLSPVIGYSEMALFDLHPEDTLYEDISQVRDAAERAKDLTHQLLAFSRKQVLDMRAISINDIVSKSENIIRRLIREDIEIVYRLDSRLGVIKGDSSQIQQILMNLATNAADAMPDGGKMIVETRNVVFDDTYVSFHPVAEKGNYALVSVSDTGSGMGKETLACIFDPFFTTKKKGRGTGLGLSTVYGIVKQHGGYVWAYSEPDMGSTMKAYIPIVEEDVAPPRNSSYSPDDTFGSETILVVEDEEAVRRLICKILDKQGYEVMEAISVTHALEIVREQASNIDLLLTDVVMPGMNGKELYDKVVSIRPEIRVLYVSGYTDDVIAHHGVLDDGVRFVQKPFSVESLTTKIRKALDD